MADSSSSSSSSSGLLEDDANTVWEICNINLARSIAQFVNKENILYNAYAGIALSTNIAAEVDLLYQFIDLYNMNTDDVRNAIFKPALEALVEFASTSFYTEYLQVTELSNSDIIALRGKLTLDQFLTMKDYKISRSFLSILEYTDEFKYDNESDTEINYDYVSPENIYTEGEWKYTTLLYNNEPGDFYHFRLDIFSDEDYTDRIYSLNSSTSQLGWYYEFDTDEAGIKVFDLIPEEGLTSEFIGRQIKFISPPSIIDTDVLGRGTVYYTRFYKITDGVLGSKTDSSDIIYT